MRLIFPTLILTFLLCGCAGTGPAMPAPVPIPETTPPTRPTEPAATVPAEPEDPLDRLLQAMTLEEQVGQLFLARCPAENALEDITACHLGGYLLFGRDFDGQTPETLTETLQSYQAAAPIPLLIAVDEEGGTVCRVSSNPAFRPQRFPAPRQAYAQGGMEQVLSLETEKAGLLSGLGINVNMAPVCDIVTDPQAFLYNRSLGQSPEETARFVSSAVSIQENHGVGSVLKHFPGYGSNADTHTGIARDHRSLQILEEADLIPFAAGIQAGADAVLVSHTVISALDDSLPASLSPAVHDYLRNTMGFDGVILTDDLVMEAITQAYGQEEAAVLAVLAGNDLLCSSEYRIQYAAVLEAVREGRIPEALIRDACRRVLAWKQELGLIF